MNETGLRKLEKLVGQGGFYKDAIRKEVCDIFDEKIVSLIEQYAPIGQGFAEQVGVFLQYTVEGSNIMKVSEEEELEKRDFLDWYAMEAYKRSKEKTGVDCWQEIELSGEACSVIEKLNELDKQIFILYSGLATGTPMTAEEIAALPEFDVPPVFVASIIQCTEYCFKDAMTNHGYQEFIEKCEHARNLAA